MNAGGIDVWDAGWTDGWMGLMKGGGRYFRDLSGEIL